MGDDRKRVTVCAGDDALAGALRIVMAGHDVTATDRLGDVASDTNALVYRVDGTFEDRELARIASAIPTIVLGDDQHLVPAVDANCRGFLPRVASLEELADAVDTVLDGGGVVPPDLLGTVLQHLVARRRDQDSEFDLHTLTDREREVYDLAVTGMRRDQIGEHLFISAATVRTHLQRVYKKLGVHSQAELIAGSSGSQTHGE